MTSTEFGTIEREIHVEATPEVVFEVLTSPEHLSQWWTDDATVEARTDAVGELVWGDRAHVAPIVVVKADPPHVFSFRWCHSGGEIDGSADSLLVTFELTAVGAGTTLRLTETGFREMGWEVAKLEEQYADHSGGWDACVGKLAKYVARLASRS